MDSDEATLPSGEPAQRDSPTAALLAHFLRNRDEPCPLCGYNLRDLPGDRCPECGHQIVLRVNAVEPRLAAAITGLIGLSAGAGLNVLLLLYGAAMLLNNRGTSGMNEFFRCNFVGAGLLGTALYIWLRSWRRIRLQARGIQWLLAVACWLLTLANLAYFTLNVK
jgi:hypothetical protein